MAKRLLGPALFFAVTAAACAQINLKGSAPTADVPYSGATRDVDLGTRKISAAEFRSTGGPSRIHLAQGTCPTAPDAGYEAVICLEAGVLYQVSASGKVPLLTRQTTSPVETFLLSSLAVSPAGIATITLAKTPAPGTRVDLIRSSGIAGDFAIRMTAAAGKSIQVAVPVRAYTPDDVIQVGYQTVE